MRLKNARVTIEIADTTGAIIALRDENKGIDFITAKAADPFRITVPALWGPKEITAFASFAMTAKDDGADLVWNVADGIRLFASVTLRDDGVNFTSYAECGEDTEITLVEYPVIGGLGSLGDDTYMAHPFATGILVKNPIENLTEGEGIRYAPYPECFSGATMQYYTYYGLNRGGLYFAAEDGESHQKWLNLYRRGGAMEATMMYGFEDMGKGKNLYAPYAYTARFLNGEGWEEASDLYKAWATQQSWCAQGPIAFREHCEWLMKKVGLCTFGINAGYDRAKYIRRYHQDVGTPVFHVLGPDWSRVPSDFRGNHPGGLSDWFPTHFSQETLGAIREVGDYCAPFEFDMMAISNKGDAEKVEEARHLFPPTGRTYSIDQYHFQMLCPCEPYTEYLHRERDVQVVREANVDAMYYDISANNLLHICLRKDHHHPVGGGNVLTKGYQHLYQDTKDACAKEKGGYFPVGTEMINEVFLPQLDFYQARAGARPASSLELHKFEKQIKDGTAELIPMFAYVYHEYGTVRMDGWGKLVEELGDFFYDASAKIYLWGGLYELNYEYSPAEAFDGVETTKEEHYWNFEKFGYEYAPGRARYLRQFAAMRVGAGNRYLAYGQMMKPPMVSIPLREKHYYHYNHGRNEFFSGNLDLPAVRISAYRSCDQDKTGYAVFLANTELDEQTVVLSLHKEDYPGVDTVTLLSDFDPDHAPEKKVIGSLSQGTVTLQLTIPRRKAVMVELT